MHEILDGTYTCQFHFDGGPVDITAAKNHFVVSKSHGLFSTYATSCSLTSTVLKNPGKLLDHLDEKDLILQIHLDQEYGVDELFCLSLIRYVAEHEKLPELAFCKAMEEYVAGDIQNHEDVDLAGILVATKHLREPAEALTDMLGLIDIFYASYLRGLQADFSDIMSMVNAEALSFYSDEMAFLQADREIYKQEAANAYSKTESFQLLMEGNTPIDATVRIYQKEPKSKLSDYWAKREGHSLLIVASENCQILALKKGILLRRIYDSLAFFEDYYSGRKDAEKFWCLNRSSITATATSLNRATLLDIIRESTNPWVSNQTASYVFPFHYDYRDFDKISKRLMKKYDYIEENGQHRKFRNNFLPLFNDYFFNNTELSNSQLHSRNFKLSEKKHLKIEGTTVEISEHGEGTAPLYGRELDHEVRIFKYGVGFLICRTTFSGEKVPLNYILEVDKSICADVRKMLESMFGEVEGIEYESTRKGIVYEAIELLGDTYVQELRESIVLKTCSATKRSYIADPKERNEEIDQKFLQRGDYLFYGFSRSCGVQYLVEKNTLDRKGMDKLKRNFMEEKFFIFLFSAQQRDALRKFSDQIVRSSLKPGKKTDAATLREDFLKFISQGKLGHISDNNVITKFYDRWQNIFDNEVIYREVSEKLDAIDQFQQSRVSHKFNWISYLLFPIIFISSFFTMNVVTTKKAIELDLPYVLIFCVLSVALVYLKMKRK